MFFIRYPILWIGALLLWILFETLATTVFSHRGLTHMSVRHSRRASMFWLWWVRSGMVNFREWVQNHLWHHANTDTDLDTHTPWKFNRLTGQRPLPNLRPWNFWVNGASYFRTSKMLAANPEMLSELAARDELVAASLALLDTFKDVEAKYTNNWRAMKFNLAVFAVLSAPCCAYWFGWVSNPLVRVPITIVAIITMAWLAIGIKVVAYLSGGMIINRYGHREESAPHHSNIPWWWMAITLWVMGEGWHERHHDAPWAANLHNYLDPGYWVIRFEGWVGVASDIRIAIKTGPRKYERRVLHPSH